MQSATRRPTRSLIVIPRGLEPIEGWRVAGGWLESICESFEDRSAVHHSVPSHTAVSLQREQIEAALALLLTPNNLTCFVTFRW